MAPADAPCDMHRRRRAIEASARVQSVSLEAALAAVAARMTERVEPDVTQVSAGLTVEASRRAGLQAFIVTRLVRAGGRNDFLVSTPNAFLRTRDLGIALEHLRDSVPRCATVVSLKHSVESETYSVYRALAAAAATAGFLHDARREFVEATWHPSRVLDWCLPHDEARELAGGRACVAALASSEHLI